MALAMVQGMIILVNCVAYLSVLATVQSMTFSVQLFNILQSHGPMYDNIIDYANHYTRHGPWSELFVRGKSNNFG